MRLTTVKVRSNNRVIEALSRKGVYIEEYDQLTGVLRTDHNGHTLWLPHCDLNVFLRESPYGGYSFYAIGTGQPVSIMCP
jgi:hypothetical protein